MWTRPKGLLHFCVLLVPDVAVEGFVLGLLAEGEHVGLVLYGVVHTCAGGLADRCEQLSVVLFRLGERRGALRTYLRELDVATLAVAVSGTIVLADFAREVMNRVLIGYFCHRFNYEL